MKRIIASCFLGAGALACLIERIDVGAFCVAFAALLNTYSTEEEISALVKSLIAIMYDGEKK